MKNFELVQVHNRSETETEVIIRDKNSFLAYGGILKKYDNPKSVYPPDYFEDDGMGSCVLCSKETDVPKDQHIDLRKYYIEGVGQLCKKCFDKIYK